VGFDLLYIGCAAGFPNIVNLAVAVVSLALFHLQILGEEEFCAKTFGAAYASYRATVRRYV